MDAAEVNRISAYMMRVKDDFCIPEDIVRCAVQGTILLCSVVNGGFSRLQLQAWRESLVLLGFSRSRLLGEKVRLQEWVNGAHARLETFAYDIIKEERGAVKNNAWIDSEVRRNSEYAKNVQRVADIESVLGVLDALHEACVAQKDILVQESVLLRKEMGEEFNK